MKVRAGQKPVDDAAAAAGGVAVSEDEVPHPRGAYWAFRLLGWTTIVVGLMMLELIETGLIDFGLDPSLRVVVVLLMAAVLCWLFTACAGNICGLLSRPRFVRQWLARRGLIRDSLTTIPVDDAATAVSGETVSECAAASECGAASEGGAVSEGGVPALRLGWEHGVLFVLGWIAMTVIWVLLGFDLIGLNPPILLYFMLCRIVVLGRVTGRGILGLAFVDDAAAAASSGVVSEGDVPHPRWAYWVYQVLRRMTWVLWITTLVLVYDRSGEFEPDLPLIVWFVLLVVFVACLLLTLCAAIICDLRAGPRYLRIWLTRRGLLSDN